MSLAPSTVPSSLDNYHAELKKLIDVDLEDKSQLPSASNLEGSSANRYAEAAAHNATKHECQAAQIVQKLRQRERDCGGRQFLKHKHAIDNSELLNIARRMPKGGHLHVHYNTCLPPAFFIEKARTVETMYVRTDRPLDAEDFLDAEVQFKVLRHAENEEPPEKLLDSGFTWMNWSHFRPKFQQCTGKDPEKWVENKIIISAEEAYDPKQTLKGIWARFNCGTRCVKGLFSYESIFRSYVKEAIQNMMDENVMYAEMRPNFFDKFIVSDDGRTKMDHHAWLNIIREEILEKQAELEKPEQFPFGFKIIYCAPRSIPIKDMEWCLADCIELKKAFPELICGFDLVGMEDMGNPIRTYLGPLLNFRHKCDSEGLDIPFLFHAGETIADCGGTDDPRMSNLYDAVLLKSKRIGHGYALPKHPLLMQKVREQDICIELCPVSNEILHLCENIQEHTFPKLLAQGVKCCVNSDNPAWFSSSLSHDFYQVLVGDENMSLHGWRKLAEWSLEYSCLNEEERKSALEIWRGGWDNFCVWVVENYGQK